MAVACVLLGAGIGWLGHGALQPPAQQIPVPVVKGGPPLPSGREKTTQEAFEGVYKDAVWGTNLGDAGTSGTGSTLESTALYRTFLASFMKNNDIHSVVDAGCGDWEFSQTIDWSGVDYKGYDIVAALVERNKKTFEKPNIQFFAANIVETDLPPADLLISKHVLQHLPTADVQKFLKQLPKYKHVLLINGVETDTLSAQSADVRPGSYRKLDLTLPPFSLNGLKVLTYLDGHDMSQVIHIAPKKN